METGKHADPTKLPPGKPHSFALNEKLTRVTGKMYKSQNGLWMMSDESKYVYECSKCSSAVEYNAPADVRSINVQLAKRFGCR